VKSGKLGVNNMDKKQRFLKVYSTLPLGVRQEIVAVLGDSVGPVTWEVAYIVVENSTELGDEILERLVNMDII